MGVKDFWPLIETVGQEKNFTDLKNETVAIDLSMWIVDSQCVKQMNGVVTKPHLRTSALLSDGIFPVFVIEGVAPELKWQTMNERLNLRQGKQSQPTSKGQTKHRTNRSHLKAVTRECCEMLDCLGVPYIQADGEAEAMCAALNQAGLVDAVITEDGDAFLYGAKTIYKNFSTTKTHSVESFSMADITSKLNLSRNHMIALGLLVGCDYSPKGVPGVGKTQAMKLISQTSADSILTKLQQWATTGLTGREDAVEKSVAQKIVKMPQSMFKQIIEEFLRPCKSVPSSVGEWKKPLISRLQNFNLAKIEWPINYTFEKILPLLTLWTLNGVSESRLHSGSVSIKPKSILKKRVRQGRECLEVLWEISDPYQIDDEDEKGLPDLTTIEKFELMEASYPLMVKEFTESKAKPGKPVKNAKVSKKKACKNDGKDEAGSDPAKKSFSDQVCDTQSPSNPVQKQQGPIVPQPLPSVNIISQQEEDSFLHREISSVLSPAFKYSQNDGYRSSHKGQYQTDRSIISLSSDDSNDPIITSDAKELSHSPEETSCDDNGPLSCNQEHLSQEYPLLKDSLRKKGKNHEQVGFTTFDFNDDIECEDNSASNNPVDQLELEFSRLSTSLNQRASNHPIIERIRRKPRDSLESLLDDISKHLLTGPVSTPSSRRFIQTNKQTTSYAKNINLDESDIILTGHMTPVTHKHDTEVITSNTGNYSSFYESDTSIPLFTMKSFSLPDSDISLLDTGAKSRTQTPTECHGIVSHITYGSFNIAPSFLEESGVGKKAV